MRFAVRDHLPGTGLLAHAPAHAVEHHLSLPACDDGYGMDEIVDIQRSSRFRRASTDSLSSLGDLTTRGNGVEVDAEHKPSSDPSESVDEADLSARRWIPYPGLGRVSMLMPKGRLERERGLDELKVPASL